MANARLAKKQEVLALDPVSGLPEEILFVIVAQLPFRDMLSALSSCKYFVCPVARKVSETYKLNTRQTDTLVRFLLGQSFFLTGAGGCGKSFVINIMIDYAIKIYGKENVAVVLLLVLKNKN